MLQLQSAQAENWQASGQVGSEDGQPDQPRAAELIGNDVQPPPEDKVLSKVALQAGGRIVISAVSHRESNDFSTLCLNKVSLLAGSLFRFQNGCSCQSGNLLIDSHILVVIDLKSEG